MAKRKYQWLHNGRIKRSKDRNGIKYHHWMNLSPAEKDWLLSPNKKRARYFRLHWREIDFENY